MAEITPLVCLPPTPGPHDCRLTRVYGAPIGRAGRVVGVTPIPISAIAIHCVTDEYEGYLAKTCAGNPRLNPFGHASFHYVMDAETGRFTSLVPEADLAWAFQSYASNFPLTCPVEPQPCPAPCPVLPCPPTPQVCIPAATAYPGWPQLAALFPNISADFYTINIGIMHPSRPESLLLDGTSSCCGPYGLSDKGYAALVRLLAWIAFVHQIPVSTQRIKFHDEIIPVNLGCEECACGSNGGCLTCDVSNYCELCDNPGDPTFSRANELFWVYGETQSGCKVRVKLSDILGS